MGLRNLEQPNRHDHDWVAARFGLYGAGAAVAGQAQPGRWPSGDGDFEWDAAQSAVQVADPENRDGPQVGRRACGERDPVRASMRAVAVGAVEVQQELEARP